MATSGAQAAGGRGTTADRTDRRRTPAQWYCLLAGLSLLLAGILGFIVDSNFDTGDGINGDKLLSIFEVNGIHNLVHLASGLLLLAASSKRASAKTVAIAFGLVYGIVTIIGLISGFMSRGRDDVPADEPRTVGRTRGERERAGAR